MIYIRVDANEQIATGHLMRTISIAEAIRKEGEDCCFITSDHNCDEKLDKRGFKKICIDSLWNDLNDEIDKMSELIKNRDIKCLLVDSYYVTPEYLEVLSKLTKVVYIDDLKAFEYSCQAVINYVIGETGKDYSYFKGELYTGTKYVPLREEFSNVSERVISDKIRKIMLTTGGADMYHFGKLFLEQFLKDDRFKECHVELVVGGKNVDKDDLLLKYGNDLRVTIFVDADNMCRLMQESDCIVSAGGTTLYEACACKTPAISYAVADNQLVNVERFSELGGLFYAGDVREGIHTVITNILDRLELMESAEMRTDIAESMGKVVDGQGAERIAGLLIKMIL